MTPTPRAPRRLPIWMLAAAAVVSLPLAGLKLVIVGATVVEDLERARTTNAARRIGEYGVCSGLGVGYIDHVLSQWPDAAILPLVRYRGPQPSPAALLNGPRRRLDRRVLIAIDIAPNETAFGHPGPEAGPALPAGYTIVGRTGRCFVALDDRFLAEIRASSDGRWRDALERIGRDGDR